MRSQPTTEYAQAGDVNIGYQVVGDGPVDLVLVWGLSTNIELMWDEPSFAAFLRHLAEFTRLIIYDRRGCGVSDRGHGTVTPTLEERMDDILAVLDAVGSERASLLGVSEGGNLSALFAATHPDRTGKLILFETIARFLRDDEHPWGWGDLEMLTGFYSMLREAWGRSEGVGAGVALWAPSMLGDDRFADWLARWARQSVSRRDIWPLMWSFTDYDLVDVFPIVRVPTLVLHRRDDTFVPVDHSRWIARHVPDATLVELDGVDHLPYAGDAEAVVAEIEDFLVGSRSSQAWHRRLLTVLVSDISDSTAELSAMGDDAWRELLAAHDRDVHAHLARFGGQHVKHLGDGCLATFDGPARSIRCAQGIVDAAARRGLTVRVGLHSGECEVIDGDVRGISVHTATHLADLARPGEILASSTVRDLVAGSGIRFDKGRSADLDGIGERPVFSVITHGANPDEVRRLVGEQANVLRRDGEYWTVAYEGHVVTLRDSKGLHDLADLVDAAGREIHVLELSNPAAGVATAAITPAQATDAGLHLEHASTDPVIDETARAAYKERILELDHEMDEAEDRADLGAAARARAERDALVSELAAAYGLGGRPRRTTDEVERARKRVTRRIRDALRRIEEEHPALGRHLRASVRTGVFCVYQPERDVAWQVELHAPQR